MKNIDVIRALLSWPSPSVLAVISDVQGPAYRPVGAMMAIFGENEYVGSLSSGCVEADITLHACEALKTGKLSIVRYGLGSKYLDIQLPCGGGLEILLIPNPDLEVLAEVSIREKARKKSMLVIDIESGALTVSPEGSTQKNGTKLRLEIKPNLRFLVFGKGPEASIFSALVVSAGYAAVVLSPDQETLEIAHNANCETKKLTGKAFPPDLVVDEYSAIILFFHDHDWEPAILLSALRTNAFYIGAQGSLRARDTRFSAMKEMGANDQQLERLHGPVGLISSARDPVTLAVSVIAEIVAKAVEDNNS